MIDVLVASRRREEKELFGFDVIVSSANSKTGKQKEMLVVDVNYFPS